MGITERSEDGDVGGADGDLAWNESALSYTLAPIKSIGVIAIWWSIPIGWFLADVTGYVYLQYMNKKAKMCRN